MHKEEDISQVQRIFHGLKLSMIKMVLLSLQMN